MQVKEAQVVLIGDMQFNSARAAVVAAKRDIDAVYQMKTNYGYILNFSLKINLKMPLVVRISH